MSPQLLLAVPAAVVISIVGVGWAVHRFKLLKPLFSFGVVIVVIAFVEFSAITIFYLTQIPRMHGTDFLIFVSLGFAVFMSGFVLRRFWRDRKREARKA